MSLMEQDHNNVKNHSICRPNHAIRFLKKLKNIVNRYSFEVESVSAGKTEQKINLNLTAGTRHR